jgi:hypothetical protein
LGPNQTNPECWFNLTEQGLTWLNASTYALANWHPMIIDELPKHHTHPDFD